MIQVIGAINSYVSPKLVGDLRHSRVLSPHLFTAIVNNIVSKIDHSDFSSRFRYKRVGTFRTRTIYCGIRPVVMADSNRRQLRTFSTMVRIVQPTRLVTVGDRAFPVAASRIWNSLPTFVSYATTIPIFRNRLILISSLVPFLTNSTSDIYL
jgi:hypothetical protein